MLWQLGEIPLNRYGKAQRTAHTPREVPKHRALGVLSYRLLNLPANTYREHLGPQLERGGEHIVLSSEHVLAKRNPEPRSPGPLTRNFK